MQRPNPDMVAIHKNLISLTSSMCLRKDTKFNKPVGPNFKKHASHFRNYISLIHNGKSSENIHSLFTYRVAGLSLAALRQVKAGKTEGPKGQNGSPVLMILKQKKKQIK